MELKEYHYVYYSYEEYGRGYFGSRTCRCLPEEDVRYFGSFRDKTFKPTQKIIFKSDYATREESYADEITLQTHYNVVENPHFANKSNQTSTKFWYKVSKEEANKGNETRKKLGLGIYGLTEEQVNQRCKKSLETRKKLGLGIFGFTPEQQHENSKNAGKYGGKKAKELGVGIHGLTPEQRSEIGKKSGYKAKELGVGIHGLTPEQRTENGKKGGNIAGKKAKELCIGIFTLTKEQLSENGKKSAKTNEKNKTAIYALTPEQRRESVKKTNSQKWMCLETGYITTSGGLSSYQKARSIDTSKRVRVS